MQNNYYLRSRKNIKKYIPCLYLDRVDVSATGGIEGHQLISRSHSHDNCTRGVDGPKEADIIGKKIIII